MTQQDLATRFFEFAHAAAARFRGDCMPIVVMVWFSDGYLWQSDPGCAVLEPREWEGTVADSLRTALARTRHSRCRPVVAGIWFSDHSSLHLTLPPATEPEAERDDVGQCKQDVRMLLQEVGHRLVTRQILDAFRQRDVHWGESTVKRILAEMVARGELSSRQDLRPRGYGLPEWQ